MAKEKATKKDTASMAELQALIDKEFGVGSLMEFDEDTKAQVEVIPSGLPSFDVATGVGGFPRGRIVEVYGPEGSGKTSFTLKVIATAQAMGGLMPRMTYRPTGEIKTISGRCGFIDVEHGFDPSLAVVHGVKMGKGTGFHFAQPDSGSEAMKLLEVMVRSGLFDYIVVDSVAGLTSDAEETAEQGDKVIAGTAGLMSDSLKKLKALINRSRTVVIFINQVREKPAVMFGSNETTPGGRALKFYSSLRIEVRKGEPIMDGNDRVGHPMKIKIVKNKVAPPFAKTEIPLYYRQTRKGKMPGFDTWTDLLEAAQADGIIELGGSQYRYVDRFGQLHKGNGQAAWRAYLEEHPEVVCEIGDRMNGVDVYDEAYEPAVQPRGEEENGD